MILNAFVQLVSLSAPLFAMVLLGWLIGRPLRWRSQWTDALSAFVLAVPLPALLAQRLPFDSALSSLLAFP